MALNATMVWRVRAGGVATNGGGYDASISGAGTDYSDQDAPQLSITDLTSTNSTTVTSALSTFTSAMVGNILRIASGAGATTGYYMISAYVSASQITLDRVSGTYTVGVAKVGGAFASINQFANGGGGTQPTLTTPLAAGHTVYIRGAGSDDPSSADYTISSYFTFPAGDTTNGSISWIGYNGRPRFNCDALLFYNGSFWRFKTLKFVLQNGSNGDNGVIYAATSGQITDIYVDQNGQDATGLKAHSVTSCKLVNTGSTTAGSYAAISGRTYGGLVSGNFLKNWRGWGIESSGAMTGADSNIIINCKHTTKGSIELNDSAADFTHIVRNNVIYGGAGPGINLVNANDVSHTFIFNNIVMNCTGYWLAAVGSTALNDRMKSWMIDYNCYNGNGNSNVAQNLSAGSHDVTSDPLFTNAGADDFTLTSSSPCKGTGYPGVAWPGMATTTQSQGYIDMGAIQRQEPSAGLPNSPIIIRAGNW